MRGLDPAKDQSYFLFTLDQAQLAHAMFPVGAMDKAAVREHARELGLSVAEKPDSHEICFVPDGDHAAFLERQGAHVPGGTIQNVGGEVVGPPRRRAPLHRRSAQGTRTLLAHPPLRRRHRRGRRRRSPSARARRSSATRSTPRT